MDVVKSKRTELGRLLTIGEASNALRVSRSTLYLLLESGRLQSVKIPGTRCRRIPQQCINRLLADGLSNGRPEVDL